jgi:4-hydroxybenzoate polyprenyltransferase
MSVGRGLVAAAHPGPALAVTLLAALLAVGAGTGPGTGVLVVAAVLTGQLSIGWSNDLLDAARDRAVGRRDKPLATGAVGETAARAACALAVLATVALSLSCGLVAGLVHLVCVAAGWAYNLGVKSTAWSWLPYAVAFGLLPVFVDLAASAPPTPAWVVLGGALLGVGAHLVNVLPDLADDAATGVRGLPHRLGATRTRLLAVAALALATVVLLLGAPSVPAALAVVALVLVAGLVALALVGGGAAPFRAAVGIAVVDVVVLVWAR